MAHDVPPTVMLPPNSFWVYVIVSYIYGIAMSSRRGTIRQQVFQHSEKICPYNPWQHQGDQAMSKNNIRGTIAAVLCFFVNNEVVKYFGGICYENGQCYVIVDGKKCEVNPSQVIVREPDRKKSLIAAGMPGNLIKVDRLEVNAAKEADPNGDHILGFMNSQPEVEVEVDEDPAAVPTEEVVVALPPLEEGHVSTSTVDEPRTIDGDGDSALRAIVDEALRNWSEQQFSDTPEGRLACLKQGGNSGQVLSPFVIALLAGNVPVYLIVRFPDLLVELHAAGEHTVFPSDETVAYAIQKLAQHHEQLLKEISRRFTLEEIQAIQQVNKYVIRWQGGITPPQVTELLNNGRKNKRRAADGRPSATA